MLQPKQLLGGSNPNWVLSQSIYEYIEPHYHIDDPDQIYTEMDDF